MDEPRTARDFAELAGRLAEHARAVLDREVMTPNPAVDVTVADRVGALCDVSRAAAATAEALAYTQPEPDEDDGEAEAPPWRTLLPSRRGEPTVKIRPRGDGSAVVEAHIGRDGDAEAFAYWVRGLRVPVRR